MEPYPYSKKKKLAGMLTKLKKKEDMIAVMKIINEDEINITENQNGLFLIFDNLSDATYYKLENHINNLKKATATSSSPFNTISTSSSSNLTSSANLSSVGPGLSSETSSDKKKYVTYFNEDALSSQEIKYTSKERNIIKRQRYENIINDNRI